jgi:hypothetical protein
MLIRASAAKFIGHLDKARAAQIATHATLCRRRSPRAGRPAALPTAAGILPAAGATVKLAEAGET